MNNFFYFESPVFLWLLMLILPLVFILNYFSYRRKRLVLGSLILWKRLLQRIETRRTSSRRFFSLSLLLLLLSCLLSVFSLSGPTLRQTKIGKLRLLLVRSAATQARTRDNSTVIQKIVRQAEKLLGDSDVSIFALPPLEGEGNLSAAEAKLLLKNFSSSHLPRPLSIPQAGYDIILSDRKEKVEPLCAVFPPGYPNCALTSLGAEERNGSLEAVARILWTGEKETETELSVECEGKTLLVERKILQKGENVYRFKVNHFSPLYKVSVTCNNDALPLDDVAYISSLPKAERRVAYFGEPEEAVLRALSAAGAEVFRFEQESRENFKFRVYNRTLPDLKNLSGNNTLLLFFPNGDLENWFSLRPLGRKKLQSLTGCLFIDGDSLKGIISEETYQIVADNGVEQVVHSTDETGAPVLCELRKDSIRMVVVGFDVSKSLWSERASFPVAVALLLRSAFGEETLIAPRIGETITIPCQEKEVEMHSPLGKTFTLKSYGGAVSFVPDTVGVWRLKDGRREFSLGVGLLCYRESLLESDGDDFIPPIPEKKVETNIPLWHSFLLAGLVLMLLAFVTARERQRKPLPLKPD